MFVARNDRGQLVADARANVIGLIVAVIGGEGHRQRADAGLPRRLFGE